jgi:flagellar protein FliL
MRFKGKLPPIAVAIAVAFGGGFGAGEGLKWLAPADAAGSGGETGAERRADGSAAAATEAVKPGAITGPVGPAYVELGQLVVPVLRNGRTTSFVLAQVTLEAAGKGEADRLKRILPHARNAILQGLYGLAGNGFFDGSSVDPAAAARVLKQGADEQLGANLVRAVLFDMLLKQNNNRV